MLLAAVAAYGAGLDYPLFFDDHEAITDNPSLRRLADAWSPPTQTPTAGRPLVNLSFALNYALSADEPRGYRLLNLGLHALNAVLAWLLLRSLLRRPVVSAALRARAEGCARAVALIWLLHPLASETVAYLTQRTELMAATFYLLTLLLAVRAFSAERAQRGVVWSAACVAACLLGSLCKETIVSAPLLVLLIDRAFFSASFAAALRARAVMYAGLLLTWVSIAWMLAGSPRGQTAGLGLGVGPLEHLATQGSIISWYLRLAFWPSPLSITYDWPLAQPLYRYAAQDALVAGLAGATLWLCARRLWIALPGVLFFGVLAPSSSVVPVLGELAAERRMYLPLLALICLVVCVAAWRLAPGRWLARGLVGLVALGCGLGTAARVDVYRSELSLWQDTFAHQPSNPIAMWGTGDALARAGRFDEALAMYERMAAEPHPYRGPFSWGSRGLFAAASIHARRGDRALARATTVRAFGHDPRSPLGTLFRAATLRKQGQREQAAAVLEAAVRQPHLRGAAQLMLSQVYAERGDHDRARALLANAAPDNTPEARALASQLLSL
ncbi:MAG TPA: tetratricopeptide repeat protein [Polyangiales bacterium]|nr:tetratricopeptide repeat protein [Polyangiales bacterium]